MGFFDLNIPYPEPSPFNRATIEATRTKLVVKAMELGYSGIAYNRTIKGVMSDQHRCSISRLTLSSLLKLAPSLSSSVKLHRELLGVSLSAPFHQYTRLTVCVDSVSQSQVLNAGNPILKTYDLVAVRPLNQTAFDQACERLEVDIIAVDFSEKLPFRLKQPMIKAAIKRGVWFEITYSGFILDIQKRRQLIANAKLLVDWTRGRNLILSSAALSVTELRGPYDVANLSLLLGISMEHAKAAVSRNCRTLVAKALRKKQFYKETIKVEAISSDSQLESDENWPKELLNWDELSPGEGDLHLDDMAKCFSGLNKASKNVKPIDFTSVMDSMPSKGFQVKDLILSGKSVSTPIHDSTAKDFLAVVEGNELRTVTDGSTDQEKHNVFSKINTSLASDAAVLHEQNTNSALAESALPSSTTEAFKNEEIINSITTTDVDLDIPGTVDVSCVLNEAESYYPSSDKSFSTSESSVSLSGQNVEPPISSMDTAMEGANKIHDKECALTSGELIYNMLEDKKVADADFCILAEMDKCIPNVDAKFVEGTSFALNDVMMETLGEVSLHDRNMVLLDDQIPLIQPAGGTKQEDVSSIASPVSPDETIAEENPGKTYIETDQQPLIRCVKGIAISKRRTKRKAALFPLNHFLNPMTFKRKPRRINCRTKNM